MSAYPWMKRYKRNLSFRYVFPHITGGWITFCRALLRVEWFFTHPIDEFLDDVREAVLWPFAVLAELGRWIVLAIFEFLKDLARGIQMGLDWLGRRSVWFGTAIAGVLGIILTLLLFLRPALQTSPVLAALHVNTPPQGLPAHSSSEAERPAPVDQEDSFDIFAPAVGAVMPTSPSYHDLNGYRAEFDAPHLQTELTRLTMPLGWSERRIARVESVPPGIPHPLREGAFDQFALLDGWEPHRYRRRDSRAAFSPYVARAGSRSSQLTPSWLTPESAVDPLRMLISQRNPAVVVEKIAPTTAPAGQPLQYTLVVRNAGEEHLESVQVRERVSAIERVTGVNPSAIVAGDELIWDIADLRPGEQRRLRVDVLPDEPLTLVQETTVSVTSGIAAQSEVRHPRPDPPPVQPDPMPSLTPEMEPEPPNLVLPDFGTPAVDLTVQETEPQAIAPAREILPGGFDIVNELPPQQEPFIEEEIVPQEPAPIPAEITSATIPSAPGPIDALTLGMTAPRNVASGEDVRTIFELHNHSDVDVTGVVLRVELSDKLQHRHGRLLELRIDRLPRGETYRTRLTTQAVQGGSAVIASRLRCTGGVEKSAERAVLVGRETAAVSSVVESVPVGCPPPSAWRRCF
ncbi:MAG: DUF11 domain-containing protein [Planctomycetaceae bacterium]|nr:DUF11 domain-containing protein [Planctomycetaceae bacterium]